MKEQKELNIQLDQEIEHTLNVDETKVEKWTERELNILDEVYEIVERNIEKPSRFNTRYDIKGTKQKIYDETDNVDRATYIPPEVQMLSMMTSGEILKMAKWQQNMIGVDENDIETFEKNRKTLVNKFEAIDMAKDLNSRVKQTNKKAQKLQEKYEQFKRENQAIQEAYNMTKNMKTKQE